MSLVSFDIHLRTCCFGLAHTDWGSNFSKNQPESLVQRQVGIPRVRCLAKAKAGLLVTGDIAALYWAWLQQGGNHGKLMTHPKWYVGFFIAASLNSNSWSVSIDLKLKLVHRLPGKTILSTFKCKSCNLMMHQNPPKPGLSLWILGSQITPVSIPCRLWMGRQVGVSKDQLRPRK